MFTGIIESTGRVEKIQHEQGNIHFTIRSDISSQLKIDQSVSHNGVCLTVVKCDEHSHVVTVINESLSRTNLGTLAEGDLVNLERCMLMNGRLDGHIVQGHVDTTGRCVTRQDENGSWAFYFEYDPAKESDGYLTVEKGSIAVNGVSLTVVNSSKGRFSVAIIPYTLENTSFKTLKPGDTVNLEFDIIGKYLARLNSLRN